MTEARIRQLFPNASSEFIRANLLTGENDQYVLPASMVREAAKTPSTGILARKKPSLETEPSSPQWIETPVISFRLNVTPRPVQSDKKVGINSKTGRRMVFTNKKGCDYYKAIKDECWRFMQPNSFKEDTWETITTKIQVEYEFHLPRPKRLMRKTDPEQALWCGEWRDLDNLIKGTQDGITQAGVWASDSLICHLVAKKFYHAKDEVPHIIVRINPIGEP